LPNQAHGLRLDGAFRVAKRFQSQDSNVELVANLGRELRSRPTSASSGHRWAGEGLSGEEERRMSILSFPRRMTMAFSPGRLISFVSG